MQQNRKKIYQDKFKEILSKSDYPKNTIIKVRIFCNVDNRFYNLKVKIDESPQCEHPIKDLK